MILDGVKVRELRKAAGLSAVEFANLISVSDSFVGYLERGTKQPKVSTLKLMADVFGVPMEELLKEVA